MKSFWGRWDIHLTKRESGKIKGNEVSSAPAPCCQRPLNLPEVESIVEIVSEDVAEEEFRAKRLPTSAAAAAALVVITTTTTGIGLTSGIVLSAIT